jgi:hypothetical protein
MKHNIYNQLLTTNQIYLNSTPIDDGGIGGL